MGETTDTKTEPQIASLKHLKQRVPVTTPPTMSRRQSGPTDGKPQLQADSSEQQKHEMEKNQSKPADVKPKTPGPSKKPKEQIQTPQSERKVKTELPQATERDESTKADSPLKESATKKPPKEEKRSIEVTQKPKPAQSYDVTEEQSQQVKSTESSTKISATTKTAEKTPPMESEHIEPGKPMKATQAKISEEKTRQMKSLPRKTEQIKAGATDKPKTSTQVDKPQQGPMTRKSPPVKSQAPQHPVQSVEHEQSLEESIQEQSMQEESQENKRMHSLKTHTIQKQEEPEMHAEPSKSMISKKDLEKSPSKKQEERKVMMPERQSNPKEDVVSQKSTHQRDLKATVEEKVSESQIAHIKDQSKPVSPKGVLTGSQETAIKPDVIEEESVTEKPKQAVPLAKIEKETSTVKYKEKKKEQAKVVKELKRSQMTPEKKVKPIELEKEEVIEGTPSEIEREKNQQHEAPQSDVAPVPKSAAEIPSQNRPAEQIVPEVEDKQKAEQTSLIEKKQELSIGIKEIGKII